MKRFLAYFLVLISMILANIFVMERVAPAQFTQAGNMIWQNVGNQLQFLRASDRTLVVAFDPDNARMVTPNLTGAAGGGTVVMPTNAGAVPTGYSCGNALAANAACANTAQGGTFHFIFGSAVLASNTSTITGVSPAFTSSTSWWCVANDITTRANPVQAIPASTTTFTITNTTGTTDTIQYFCYGN